MPRIVVAGNVTLGSGIETYMNGPSKDLGSVVTNEGRFVFLASDPAKPPTGHLECGSHAKFDNVFIADERTGIVGPICCTLQ